MLPLRCPAQNYAWGRPATSSEVRLTAFSAEPIRLQGGAHMPASVDLAITA